MVGKIYVAGIAVALVAAAGYGLIQYGRALERADNNEIIAELQSKNIELGRIINKLESEKADATRRIQLAEKERINAIQTADHQTSRINSLESQLHGIIREQRKADAKKPDLGPVRILLTATTERVWNEARSSDRLTTSESTGVLQKRLPAVTGDDINGLIKYAIGEYNSCAIKYNKLWRACDRLIESTQKNPGARPGS